MSKDDSRPLTRDLAPFGVRLPPDLKSRIQVAAEENNRSMNAEIVATLEEKYPAPSTNLPGIREVMERLKKAETGERGQEILSEVNRMLEALEYPFRLAITGPRKPDGSWNVEVTYL